MQWMSDLEWPETAHEARVLSQKLMDDAAAVLSGADVNDGGAGRNMVERCHALIGVAGVCATLAVSMQMAEDRKV